MQAAPPEFIRALSVVLCARRLELGLSQRGLARKVGICRGFVARLEAGLVDPDVTLFWRLADALELAAAELATRVEAQMRTLDRN